jgi:hypothetical protein
MEYRVSESDNLMKRDDFISTSSHNLYEICIQGDMHPAKKRFELFRHAHASILNIAFRDIDRNAEARLTYGIYATLRQNEPLSREDGIEELPETGLWIYGERWSVEMMPARWRNSGHVNSISLGVQINSSLPAGEQFEVAWHEMYHHMCLAVGISEKESDCIAAAHLMCNFLSDNDMTWMYVDLTDVSYTPPPYEGCCPKPILKRQVLVTDMDD